MAFATPWCIHPQTKDKIHVVFDAAAMQDVVSLNHELIAPRSSPNQQPAGSSTEVQAISYRTCEVKVPQEDSDALRFLWWGK